MSGRLDAFFSALEAGSVRIQTCRACGESSTTPRTYCPDCGADEWAVEEREPAGTLYSATTIHVVGDPAIEPPLRVGVVEFDGGARLTVRLDGDVDIGDDVALVDVVEGQGRPVAVFGPGGTA